MKIVCDSCGEVAEGEVRVEPNGVAQITCAACGAVQSLGEREVPAAEPAPLRLPEGKIGWKEVLACWTDDAVHRSYLAGSLDLAGLTEAGQHYREVLESRPEDPMARRWRDEIVRRASALALAQIPRTAPPRPTPPWVRWLLVGAIALLGALSVVALVRLVAQLRGRAVP